MQWLSDKDDLILALSVCVEHILCEASVSFSIEVVAKVLVISYSISHNMLSSVWSARTRISSR